MCIHKYTIKHYSFNNSTCNYSETYKVQLENGEEQVLDIPHDKEGKCIFHSNDIEWKQKNGFFNKFIELIEILKATKNKNIDFREFIFVGKNLVNDEISENYKLTDYSVAKLNKDKLNSKELKLLLDEKLKNRNDFSASIKKVLKKEPTKIFLDLILKHSEHKIAICNLEFNKNIIFNGSVFYDSALFYDIKFNKNSEFKNVIFKKSVEFINNNSFNFSFENADFRDRVYFKDVENKGFNFMFATFANKATFDKIESLSYCSFDKMKLSNTFSLSNSKFRYNVDFSDTKFETKDIYKNITEFKNIEFLDSVDFNKTEFNCSVNFDNIFFDDNVSFIDTIFSTKENANSKESSVNFKSITVSENSVVEFKSTDAGNKIFQHEVSFSKEVIEGTISFENVNFNKIYKEDRVRFLKLQKDGKIVIGSGCIKYRHQTEPRTININDNIQNLTIELMNTFTTFFIERNGMNLGMEIIERDSKKIKLFYFSDSDMKEEDFDKILMETEFDMMNFINNPEMLQLENENIKNNKKELKKYLARLNMLSDMARTRFKIAIGYQYNQFTEKELAPILESLHFGNEKFLNEGQNSYTIIVENFHNTTNNNYTQKQLFSLNSRQSINKK